MKISTTEVHKLLYGDRDGDTVITQYSAPSKLTRKSTNANLTLR